MFTRDERQELGIKKFCAAGHRATWQWTTGFGKTRAAIKVINLLRRTDKTRKVIVVVPGIQLKAQWEKALLEAEQLEHTEVIVINTLILRLTSINCTLLILDEIHRLAANTFSRVFVKVIYQFVLGLTATFDRLDGKQNLIKRFAPVCDVVDEHEARRNRWVAQTREYNLGITMTDEEQEEYDKLKDEFQNLFDKFDNSFDRVKKCCAPIEPKVYTVPGTNLIRCYPPECVKRAQEVGWRGNTAEEAYRIFVRNKTLPKKEKRSVWGGDLMHPYHPEKLFIFAINCMRVNMKMKQFVYRFPRKIDVAEELIRGLNLKTITFAEVTESADEIKRRFGDEAVVYHSSLKTTMIEGKKVTAKNQKLLALKAFMENRARIVASAKALDEGTDFPDVELGVSTSFTSAPRQRRQRRGRVGRLFFFEDGEEKEAIMVYIYIKKTKEYYWLTNAQEKDKRITWVDSVNEILEKEGMTSQSQQVGSWV